MEDGEQGRTVHIYDGLHTILFQIAKAFLLHTYTSHFHPVELNG